MSSSLEWQGDWQGGWQGDWQGGWKNSEEKLNDNGNQGQSAAVAADTADTHSELGAETRSYDETKEKLNDKGNQGQSAAVAADTDSGWHTQEDWKKVGNKKHTHWSKAATPPTPTQRPGKAPPPPPPPADAAAFGQGSVAAAASSGGMPLTVFDIVFFREWPTHNAYRDNYKQHNAALKWLRQLHEPTAVAAVELQPYDMQIAQILHPKGMDYSFDENIMLDWSWLEMVAQLDENSMLEVVGGGLVRCEFSRRPNSYDHATHFAMNAARNEHEGPQLRIWDFVLWREDGSGIRLHPQWSRPSIATFAPEGHAEQVQCPRKGPGRSDGKGTYKKYKEVATQGTLKFDHEKRPLRLAA